MHRVVVVSGGGTGIGAAAAELFVADGAEVYLLGRREKVLAATADKLGPRAHAIVADLRSPPDVEAALAALPESVDVLVNNAGARGVADGGGGLVAVAARWTADFHNNVLVAVLLTTALIPRLASPGGRVVTVSSLAAVRGNGSYGAAKAMLHGWNLALAGELGPRGVTANVVVPGYVAGTEFFGPDAVADDGERRRRAAQTLVNRVGEPNDVAAAVRYLASPDAGYVTGQFLHVNGGALPGR
jgi:3-oxoacyl-[acyl-carrier protein] reductase